MQPKSPQTIIGQYTELWQEDKPPTVRLAYFNERRPFPHAINRFNNRMVTTSGCGGTRITSFMKVDSKIRIVNRGRVFTLILFEENLTFTELCVEENTECAVDCDRWFAVLSDNTVMAAIASENTQATLIYEET